MSVYRFDSPYYLGADPGASDIPHFIGTLCAFKDLDYSLRRNVLVGGGGILSGFEILARWVKNVGSTTLLPSEIPSWSTVDNRLGLHVDGKAGADTRGAGVVDPFGPSAGYAQNDHFWLIIFGPAKVIQVGTAAIDAGDPLKTAATGRADEQNTADADEIPEVNARFGVALEDVVITAGTKFRALVDFRP